MNKSFWIIFMISVALVGYAVYYGGTVDKPGDDGDGGYEIGKAPVDRIQIATLTSFPLQVQVEAFGNLADGCTKIDKVTQSRQGNQFTVIITTKRPKEAFCTLALVPFRVPIALAVYGLKAGTYQVEVGNARGSFTFDSDNILPGLKLTP